MKIKCVQKADFYFLSGHLSKKVCQYLPGDNGREGVSQIMTNGDGVKISDFAGTSSLNIPLLSNVQLVPARQSRAFPYK